MGFGFCFLFFLVNLFVVFFFNFLFFIGVQPVNNVVILSDEQEWTQPYLYMYQFSAQPPFKKMNFMVLGWPKSSFGFFIIVMEKLE